MQTLTVQEVNNLFRNDVDYEAMFNEIITLMYGKYKATPPDIGFVANLLGHFAWYGIKQKIQLEITLDEVESIIKTRGWNLFNKMAQQQNQKRV